LVFGRGAIIGRTDGFIGARFAALASFAVRPAPVASEGDSTNVGASAAAPGRLLAGSVLAGSRGARNGAPHLPQNRE
jgi:hypothetical protein